MAENSPLKPSPNTFTLSPQSPPSEIDPITNKPPKTQLPSEQSPKNSNFNDYSLVDSELGYDVSEKSSNLDCVNEITGEINEQSYELFEEKSSLDCVDEVSSDDNKVSGIQLEQNNENFKGLNFDDGSVVDNKNNRVSGISRVFDDVSTDNNRASGIQLNKDEIDEFLELKDEVNVIKRENSSEIVQVGSSENLSNEIIASKSKTLDGNSKNGEDGLNFDDVSAVNNKNNRASGIQLNKDEISEFLELKDEVNVIKREKFSEIVQVGSSESQSNEITSSKSKMLDGSPNDVVGTVTMELVDETVVVNDYGVGKKNRRRGKKGNSDGMRKSKYARKELEKLRFVNVKSQKKFWKEVYYGFDESVRKEYDVLGSFKQNNGQAAGKRHKGYQGNLGDSSSKMTNVKYEEDLVEWSEVDDESESEDEYFSIQRPAFMVEGEPDFESGSPEDGFEYLRRVRWEAAHIPNVKVVKPDNSKLTEQSVYMPNIPDIEKCPPHLAPLKQWEDEFVAEFSELRLVLSSLGETNDTTSADSNTIIFNHPESTKRTSKSQASLELPKGDPNLSTLLAMDPVTRVGLLNKRIKLFESASSLSKDDCRWIFALCAVVETPLDADTCASIRCLLRRCGKLRAEKDEFDYEVVMLNILVTIAGRIFGQSKY